MAGQALERTSGRAIDAEYRAGTDRCCYCAQKPGETLQAAVPRPLSYWSAGLLEPRQQSLSAAACLAPGQHLLPAECACLGAGPLATSGERCVATARCARGRGKVSEAGGLARRHKHHSKKQCDRIG